MKVLYILCMRMGGKSRAYWFEFHQTLSKSILKVVILKVVIPSKQILSFKAEAPMLQLYSFKVL